MAFFARTARYIFLAILFYSATQYFLRWKSYRFSPKLFRQRSFTAAQGTTGLTSVNRLRAELSKDYRNKIIDSPWEFAYSGGLTVRISFLHASLFEVIVAFHAPHRTEGFAGLYWMNSTCTVLNGAVLRTLSSANAVNRESYKQGNNFRHGEFQRYFYEFAEDTYMVCYGRGAVPLSSLWLALGSISAGDPVSLAKISYVYTQGVVYDLSTSIKSTYDHYKSKVRKSEL